MKLVKCQEAYIDQVFLRFGMQESKPVKTLVDTSSKLVKATEEDGIDKTMYSGLFAVHLHWDTAGHPLVMLQSTP